MLNPNTKLIKLSENEYTRYSKQLILSSINIEGQKRLKKSKVLVIGLGGLGNPIAIYLAASGIGYIGLLDEDHIELSNLNRQIIYKEIDINQLKVISAKNRISKLNNNCKVITHAYRINKYNSKEIINYYDIVIDTTDNFNTRYIINEACYTSHKTYIYGAVEQFIGQVSIFNYKDGIKYNYLYPKNLNLKTQNCNTNGVMGIATGYIGTLQATEIIKVITGQKNKLNNKVILCNLLNTELKIKKVYNQQYKINKNITKHERSISKKLISKENEAKQKLIILIDIRNNREFNKRHIKKSINIPLESFKLYKTLKFIKKQTKQKYFYVYCKTLHKSIIVSTILKNNQINNHNILGKR
uniref:Molybdopterin biosynthesis protein n=1 Tax=Chondria sp. (in: red algae) TaxID=1982705 RepID=A0A1Z1MRD1_9FLOR|nr:Molybdopterin biosynthesis protein [Chondria sp. (in: red algae)]